MKHNLFLLLLALLAGLDVAASETINGICYDLDAETHTATVVKSTYSGTLNIPATIDVDGDDTPYTVTKIGDSACLECTSLLMVTMQNTIEEIGLAAFKGCTNLKLITLSSALTAIRCSAFEECTSLKKLEIPENVETIEKNTFYNCSALESISFGSKWKSMGTSYRTYDGYATLFYGCYKLNSITVDENNEYFKVIDGKYLVSKQEHNCPGSSYLLNYKANQLITTVSLDEVNLPTGIEYLGGRSLCNCTANMIVIPEGVLEDFGATTKNTGTLYFLIYPTTLTGSGNQYGAIRLVVKLSESDIIDDHFVFNKTSKKLTGYVGFDHEITLPEDYNGSAYSIADEALQKYNNFYSVTIPNNVKGIGKYAFYQCENLQTVSIGTNVTSIDENAFYDCKKLETVTFAADSKLSTINQYAFEYCWLLKNITLPSNLTQIGNGAFSACTSLESITIPNGVTAINNYTFSVCRALTEINIPENVVYIGDGAFSSCEALKSITLPSNLMMLGESAFGRCTSLSTINIPEGIEEIPACCFVENAFTEFVIPEGVKTIGKQAFLCCGQLKKITAPSTLTSVEDYAFESCNRLYEINNNSDIIFTVGSEEYGQIAKNARRVLNNKQLEKVGDFLFDKNTKSLALYTGTDTDVVFPETYNGGNYDIKAGAFLDNQTVENITFGDHVTAIETYAFFGCTNLKSVELSQNLHSIGAFCFEGCASLKEIHLPQQVTEIPEQAFFCCSSLEKISYSDQLTKVDSKAFHLTNLFYIIVPKTVTEAVDWSFFGPKIVINNSNLTIKPLSQSTQTIINQRAATVMVRNYLNDAQTAITADLTTTDFYDSVKEKINHPNAIVSIAGLTEEEMPFNYVSITKNTLDNRSTNWEAPRITLTDGDYFSSHFSTNVNSMNYKRNFTETGWQALYLPYELKYDDWKDLAEVARFESATDDGTNILLNCTTVTSGSIPANTPCLIKPKQGGEMILTSKDVHIDVTPTDGSLSPVVLGGNNYIFKIWGNYREKTDMFSEQYYALSNGNFCQAANGSVTLQPFRIYLSVIDRNTGLSVSVNTSSQQKAPRIVIDEFEDTATSISQVPMEESENDVYFDLSGRRVNNPEKGIYIKNGKKIAVK